MSMIGQLPRYISKSHSLQNQYIVPPRQETLPDAPNGFGGRGDSADHRTELERTQRVSRIYQRQEQLPPPLSLEETIIWHLH